MSLLSRVPPVLLLALASTGCGLLPAKPLPVEVSAAAPGPLTEAVYATGTVQPEARAMIRARIGGRVEELTVKAGEAVTAGQALARIRASDQAASLDVRRTAAAEARAALAQARDDAERAERLGDAAAPADRARARNSLALAQARLSQAESNLRLTQAQLSDALVVAPMDGVVVDVPVGNGDTVAPNANLLELLAPDSFQVALQVDESEVAKVKTGQAVTFTLDAFPAQKFTGSVRRIVPRVDPLTRTSEVWVAFDALPDGLQDGMTATANIVIAQRDGVLQVPRAALRYEGSETVVWAVEGGKAVRKVVTVGAADADSAEITAGLAASASVVLAGEGLKDGAPVTVAAPSPEKKP